ncbi:hypothetical protein KL86APRO_12393 [uncultured Alphaproteobacteria bacterium]|uniref:Uncharacterized protein n=1 Tax=uncultured Alphaproteobacteria bacterium TaxID=91750 RepID=A0A212K9R9_9PROT|nr:hypothetical protein KL86APRO_12393 [uncultured Alphaproteobacteria bacterium]
MVMELASEHQGRGLRPHPPGPKAPNPFPFSAAKRQSVVASREESIALRAKTKHKGIPGALGPWRGPGAAPREPTGHKETATSSIS